MAVEIPVVIDIDKAFQEAANKVNGAITPLQRQISKKQLNVAINVGTQNNQVMKKFGDLLKGSNVSAKELEAALKSVNTQITTMQQAGGFNPTKGLKNSERDLLALRAALEVKLENGNFIDQATEKTKKLALNSNTAEKSVRAMNRGLREQGGIMGMLTRYISVYTAAFAGLRLIRNIRETTAEFEMQKVALGGIIQDATKANQLFADIKAAAVKSPFEIKDLVSYTKQLSAYRIETDKLFNVTMRLADISSGLGVDMSRLVLAYGQVRAAAVLRGQELRQFTEAGIPLVELLANKFSTLRNEMVSTGEVFELISERAVPFAMIEEIFNDMTDAGGIFYQMQLKQSETLKGQWMNLKDSISIAYDEMGRTAMVNKAMTGWIHTLSELAKNWERIASVVNVAVYSYIAYRLAVKNHIPLYNMQQKAITRQIQLEKQQQIEQIRLASSTNKLSKADQARIAKIKQMNAEDLKRIYTMDKMTQSQAMMLFWRNKDNKEMVKAITQTGILTKTQMNAIKNMNKWQIHLKTWMSSLRTFSKSVGTAIASFWPIAVISALITTITSLIQSSQEQAEAIKKVDEAYREQEQSLLTIETAYRRIQQAIADVEDEGKRLNKEASVFGQKLAYAQKVVEMLKKYGLGGDFDLSLLNTDNIDDFVNTWLNQLNEANELTRDWGRNVAQVANAWEASVLGLHLAGDNLNTDIKQLTKEYVRMTSDKQYRQNLDYLRSYVDQLELTNKSYYDIITADLGEDAKLALAQKRRNETEYQYQRRIIQNYEIIRKYAGQDSDAIDENVKLLYSMKDPLDAFEKKLDEVEDEFDKTWGSMAGKDEITIKMAIDKLFAENQWEDWLKEAWIERINGKYNMNIQITPTVSQVNISRGMKGILTTEFEGLFTEQELENLNSITDIGKAIDEKMANAASSIADADKQANNLVNNELWAAQTKEKIEKAQKIINDEMQKAEKDRNQDAIEQAYALIKAMTEQNGIYDEQIQKKKDSAKAEYELAKAAKERLLNEGLSDMGKDIKQTFPGLMKDAYREVTDENYIGKFLLSEDDLQNVKDASDAYDLWSKNMKAIADDREKMAAAGVTDKTVAEEQARLEAERQSILSQIAAIDEQITEHDYEEFVAKRDILKLAIEQATTADARRSAEENYLKFMSQTSFSEAAALVIEKERLKTNLGITNAALGAQTAITDYFATLDNAQNIWEEFGKRYNFTLKDTPKGGSSGEDPWILLFKNRMKFMQDFQQSVEDLNKFLSHSESLVREQGVMKGRGLSLGIKTEDLLGTPNELRQWYDKAIKEVVAKIQSMGGKQFAGLGVTEILAKDLTGRKIQKYQELLQELWKGMTDFDTNEIKQELEKKIKDLTEEIKRSETARNFYNNILELTGDHDLAATMSISVYGGIGDEFRDRLQQQLNEALSSLKPEDITEELREAFSSRNFDVILANLDKFPDKWQEVLRDMADSSQKFDADRVKDLLKALEQAKTYGEQRVKLAEETARREREIEELQAPESVKSKLKAQNIRKEAEEAAKLEYEAFKDSPMYIALFDDLDSASVQMLTDMKESLVGLKSQWKDLAPTELKELQSRINELDEQLASRNPFKALIASIKAYREMQETMPRAEADWQATDANNRLNLERQILDNLAKEYQEKVRQYGIESDEAREARDAMNIQATMVDLAKDTADAAQATADEYDQAAKNIMTAATALQTWVGYLGDALDKAGELVDTFGSDDFSETFGIVAEGAVKTLTGAGETAMGVAKILTGTDIAGGIMDLVSGLGDLVVGIGGTTKKRNNKEINKQIEDQANLVENLEYEYSKLGAAMDRAFGNEYVYNYTKQLEVLKAKIEAYNKQADLEESKGKKADKQKVQKYRDQARETVDEMADLRDRASSFFAGSDLASAAESFADAWLSAYQEFGDTSSAIEERMTEMVQNIMKKAALSGIAESILGNWYSSLSDVTDWNAQTIAQKWKEAMALVDPMVQGMQVFANSMQAEGISLRNTAGQFTGISRDIAGASEESINGLAAGINTQNFYMSFMPLLHENVAQILTLMSGGNTVTSTTDTGIEGMPSVQKMVYDHLPYIDANINSLLQLIKSVISPKSASTATHYVSVK